MTDRKILGQAQEHAPLVLPKPIARLVTDELRRGFMAAAARLHYPEYDELARAVLDLPVPAPAVDREGLAVAIETAWCNPVNGGRLALTVADALISAGLIRGAVTAEHLSEITRRYHDDAYVSTQDDITRWYATQFGIAVADPEEAPRG